MDVIRPSTVAQRREALVVLMSRPDSTPAEIDQQIEALLRYSQKHGFSLENCLLGREGGRAVSACLLVDSPGRTSSVFLPVWGGDPCVAAATAQLLCRAVEGARLRDIQFLQGMVTPEALYESEIYSAAGFVELTTLLYLENDLSEPLPASESTQVVSWKTYGPDSHALFAQVVQGTYVGSLDCGALNGQRHIEDALASHRGTSDFDPRLWLVGTVGRSPVGVVLLTHQVERWSLDVAYMGLLPEFRGRGYGSTLLRRAFDIAREQAVMTITLTVDIRNEPARRLYSRFGFREVSRRHAWIRFLS